MKFKEIKISEIPNTRETARGMIRKFVAMDAEAIEITEHNFNSMNSLRGAFCASISRMGLANSIKVSIRDGRAFLIKTSELDK